MPRYIDADALKQKFINADADGINLTIDRYAIKCIDDAPTADVVPVKRGKWIPSVDRWGDIITTVDGYTCSDCGFFDAYEDRYCPNCGATMDGGADTRKDDSSHPLADSDDIYGG